MVDFIVKNYILIIVVASFLIFALIGYAVDSTKNRNNKEADLLNKPNDDMDINMIKEEDPAVNEESIIDVNSASTEEDESVNLEMDN